MLGIPKTWDVSFHVFEKNLRILDKWRAKEEAVGRFKNEKCASDEQCLKIMS